MSLIQRTLLILIATLFALVAVIFVIMQISFMRNASDFEYKSLQEQVRRLQSNFYSTVRQLDGVSGAYASFDRTYQASRYGADRAFGDEFANATILKNANISFFGILNAQNILSSVRMMDYQTQAERLLPEKLRAFLVNKFSKYTPDETGATFDFFPVDNHFIVLYGRQISNNFRTTDPVGTVVVGVPLEAVIAHVADDSQLDLVGLSPDSAEIPATVREELQQGGQESDGLDFPHAEAFDGNTAIGYLPILNHQGDILYILRFQSERVLLTQATNGLRVMQVLLVASGLVFGAVLVYFLRRNVLKPIAQLSDEVQSISQGGGAARVMATGKDEIGALGDAINSLLEAQEMAEDMLLEHESELRRNAELFSAVIDSSPDFIVAKDKDFRYQLVNEAWAQSIGKEKYEIIGKTDLDFFPEVAVVGNPTSGLKGFRHNEERVLNAGEEVQIPKDMVKVGKEVFVYSTIKKPLRDENAQITGVLSYSRDVTPLIKGQEERDRLIREMQEAVMFKDQFLATMSHELRTPLNAILGFSSIALMQHKNLPEQVNHMLERVKYNAKRLLSLINDVLDISRINANRIELVNRPANLHRLAEGWIGDVRQQAADKGIELFFYFDPTLPQMAVLDEERVTQIAANLLNNAIKFTDKGTVTLKVDKKGADWTFSVIDTGIGIPDTWHHLIFEEFRQVDGSTRREYGGAGLGLSIVQKLCRLMGGSVQMTSKLGQGSTFIVRLPIHLPEAEAASA